jgi:hypothetical protein
VTETLRVLLDPANPHDFDFHDFDTLVEEITLDLPDASVIPTFREEVGYGGPLMEVLHVWIDVTGTIDAVGVTAILVKRLSAFMKERFTADETTPGDLGPPRTRIVNLYDGDGNVLMTVTIDGSGVAEHNVSGTGKTAPHPRPAPRQPDDC